MKPRLGKPVIGRADLLRVGLSPSLGRALGYGLLPEGKDPIALGLKGKAQLPELPPRIEFVSGNSAEIPFLMASSFRTFGELEKVTKTPSPHFASPRWLNRPTDPPEYIPLASIADLIWRLGRMAPGIRQSRKPDADKIVQRLAKVKPITSLPRKQYPAQSAPQIVYDRSPRLAPYWRDHRYVQAAAPEGSNEFVFEAASRRFLRIGTRESHVPAPEDGPIVVFGDLGAFGPPDMLQLWVGLGQRFAESGVPAFALVPCALSDLSAEMTSVWQVSQWEARAPLDPGEREKAVEELLMWCSYAGRVEPGLLRALRLALTDADAVCEILVSRHKAVASPSAEALTLDPHAIAEYRRRFEQEATRRPELARRAWQILRSWRQPIGDEFMFEELLSLPSYLRETLRIDADDIAHAEAFWSKMAAGARDGSLGNRAVEWLERVGIRREPDAHGILDHAAARQAIEWAIERRLGTVARSDKLPIVVAGDRLLAGETSGSPIGTIPYANGGIWVDASPAEDGPSPLPHPLTTFRDPLADGTFGPEMVSIPTGAFLMGSPKDEKGRAIRESPQHEVQIDEPYALAKYPVTFDEYDDFCDATGRDKPDDRGWGRGRRPVINVSWHDAQAYCGWLSEQTAEAYRLPSEAEWEHACRANTTTSYWWGKNWNPKAANWDGSGQHRTTEVGSYPANRWGLHDTHGNVFEWCEDKWLDDYTTPRTQTAILGTPGEARRALRGGSWNGGARLCRSAFRDGFAPVNRDSRVGFRPARGQAIGAQGSQGNAERSGLRAAEAGVAEPPVERPEGTSRQGRGEAGFLHRDPIRRRVMPGGSASIPLAELPPAPFVIRTDRAELVIQRITRSDLGAWASGMGRDRFGLWADFTVEDLRQRLRWCPPGRFLMGSPEDEPGRLENEGQHIEITFAQGFWMFETPVTQDLYKAITGSNPSRFRSPCRPVEMVFWNDAVRFMARLHERLKRPDSKDDGFRFMLPTEAQWEYACRAGTSDATYAGPMEILGERNAPILDDIAWYGGNSGTHFELDEGHDSSRWSEKRFEHSKAGTMPVKMKRANPWGLHDMLGNVWEWCADAWQDSHKGAPLDGNARQLSQEAAGATRVIRGGAWDAGAGVCRSAYRFKYATSGALNVIGFRPVGCQVSQGHAERSGLLSADGRGERGEGLRNYKPRKPR